MSGISLLRPSITNAEQSHANSSTATPETSASSLVFDLNPSFAHDSVLGESRIDRSVFGEGLPPDWYDFFTEAREVIFVNHATGVWTRSDPRGRSRKTFPIWMIPPSDFVEVRTKKDEVGFMERRKRQPETRFTTSLAPHWISNLGSAEGLQHSDWEEWETGGGHIYYINPISKQNSDFLPLPEVEVGGILKSQEFEDSRRIIIYDERSESYQCFMGKKPWREQPRVSQKFQKAVLEYFSNPETIIPYELDSDDWTENLLSAATTLNGLSSKKSEIPDPLLPACEMFLLFYITDLLPYLQSLHPHCKSLGASLGWRDIISQNINRLPLNGNSRVGELKDQPEVQHLSRMRKMLALHCRLIISGLGKHDGCLNQRWRAGLLRLEQVALLEQVLRACVANTAAWIDGEVTQQDSKSANTVQWDGFDDRGWRQWRDRHFLLEKTLTFFQDGRFRSDRLEKLILGYLPQPEVNTSIVDGIALAEKDLTKIKHDIKAVADGLDPQEGLRFKVANYQKLRRHPGGWSDDSPVYH
ncbi:hypothetical protein BJ508DRAFT_330908 [Ascobolus immersus RN42]|uniref:WW domain-containing protein n=1 Tax=Ascobolus immersus RN42 TaxID=1160509 RepID=A0A3N4HUC0_ASCIM|nr:hypothetical protein BJ508DRAFT_330908 [Ascobolus immersus RN42]